MQILPDDRPLHRAPSGGTAFTRERPRDAADQHRLRQLLPALPARPLRRQRDARAGRLQRRAGQRRQLGRATRAQRGGALTVDDIPFPETRAYVQRVLERRSSDYRAHVPRTSSGWAADAGTRRVRYGLERRCPTSSSTPPSRPPPTSRKAIAALAEGVEAGERFQTLLGATGTGKTMTMAGVIEAVQRPALVIAHNKTLAAQLCNEFRTFFPDNAVEYFVSYYDYYQPEAYVPSRDLYIEKDSAINQEIDRLRHAATAALFARRDVIVVASVSCIYGLGSPETYEMNMQILQARRGDRPRRAAAQARLDPVHAQRHGRSRAAPSACAARRSRSSRPTPRRPSARRCSATRSSACSTSTRSPASCSRTTSSTSRSGRRRTTTSRRARSSARVAEIGARAERALRASSRPRASCSSPTACASARSTTWRCCARWASARGSRTTRGSSTGASRASGRTA